MSARESESRPEPREGLRLCLWKLPPYPYAVSVWRSEAARGPLGAVESSDVLHALCLPRGWGARRPGLTPVGAQASSLQRPGQGSTRAHSLPRVNASSSGSGAFAFHMKMFLQQPRMPAFLWSQSDVFNYIGQNPRRLFPWLQPVSERYLEPPSYPKTKAVSAPPALYRLQRPQSGADPSRRWGGGFPPNPSPARQPSPHSLRSRGRAGSPVSVLVPSQGSAGGHGHRAAPRALTQGCPSSTKPAGASGGGDRWHSHPRGQPSPHRVPGRGRASHLRKLESLGRATQHSDCGGGFMVRRIPRTFQIHFPFPTVLRSPSFVQSMLICVLNALRRPARRRTYFV